MKWLLGAYAAEVFAFFLIGYCPYRALTIGRFHRIPKVVKLMGGVILGYILAFYLQPLILPLFEAGYSAVYGEEVRKGEMMEPDGPNLNTSILLLGWIATAIGIGVGQWKLQKSETNGESNANTDK